jgi:hypothetical protein
MPPPRIMVSADNPGGSWSQCGFLYGSVCGLDPYPGGFVPPDLVDIAVDAFATPNRVPTENPPPLLAAHLASGDEIRVELEMVKRTQTFYTTLVETAILHSEGREGGLALSCGTGP